MTHFKTTFVNSPAGQSELDFLTLARQHLASRIEDFKFFEENGHSADDLEEIDTTDPMLTDELAQRVKVLEGFHDLGDFYDYGLCLDVVTKENDWGGEVLDFVRFQISWGGPSEEVRFYPHGVIEFVYLDWFSGVGFDVTDCPQFDWSYAALGVVDKIEEENAQYV